MDKIHKVTVGCPLCGSSNTMVVLKDLIDVEDRIEGCYTVGQCGECGLHYLSTRPDVVSLPLCYRRDYHAQAMGRRGGLRGFLYQQRFAYRARRLERYGHGMPESVLEIGCGDGAFLRYLAKRWRSVKRLVGVDPGLGTSVTDVDGVRLSGGHFEAMAFMDQFSLILLYDVLEHVYEPLSVIRKAATLLAPGGRLIIQVPNWDSWWRKVFPRHWEGLQVPRHMSFFTPGSLQRLIEMADLKCYGILPVYDPGELSVSLCNWSVDHWRLKSRPRELPGFAGLALLAAPLVAIQVFGCGNAGEMELVAGNNEKKQ